MAAVGQAVEEEVIVSSPKARVHWAKGRFVVRAVALVS